MPSSVIAEVSYDESLNTLDVTFRSGRVYRYYAVPAHVYRDLLESRSKGRYFNERIRPVYPSTPVTTAPPPAGAAGAG